MTTTDFVDAMTVYPPSRFSQFGARFIHEKFRKTIISPVHSAIRGGRYNRAGLQALYLGLTRATALAEYTKDIADNVPTRPCSMVSVLIVLHYCINLDSSFLATLGLTLADISQHEMLGGYRVTQQIGDYAVRAGVDGIVYPSSVHPGYSSIVIFPDNCATSGAYVYSKAGPLLAGVWGSTR